MQTIVITGQNMDPGVTPAQGRVVFHQERLLRSVPAPAEVIAEYRQRCLEDGLPEKIGQMSRRQCRSALYNLEAACLSYPRFARLRDCRTQWQSI